MSTATGITWLKLPIIGMPGMECGRWVTEGGETEVMDDFKNEYGPCDKPARWSVGMLLVCQDHAAIVAREFGDDITDIEKAWRAQL